jgi:hypothetical protein
MAFQVRSRHALAEKSGQNDWVMSLNISSRVHLIRRPNKCQPPLSNSYLIQYRNDISQVRSLHALAEKNGQNDWVMSLNMKAAEENAFTGLLARLAVPPLASSLWSLPLSVER